MAFEFRRPLGLVLSGGGSHGAWESGCLEAFRAGGLAFDKILGFSIGAVVGASYFLGLDGETLRRWRELPPEDLLRWRPRLGPTLRYPFSLFSEEALWGAVEIARDEEAARRAARCELVVVSHRVADRSLEYARFSPDGRAGWDGPLMRKLAGSCAVPFIFPPVAAGADGSGGWLVDGGVPGREPMRFDALAGCRDVIVVQTVRPEELGRARSWLRNGLDQIGREMCARHLSDGVRSLASLADAPRIFRFMPSAVLDFNQLKFSSRHCGPAVDRGLADGAAFLRQPAVYLS